MTAPKTNDVASLQAQLRQVDDLAAKGLLRPEEADEARQGLRRRLLQAVVPDEPAPRLTWRARLWALAAMAALVAALAAYLLSGHAGLRRESLEALEAARIARAEREAAGREGFERLRADKARAVSAPAASAPSSGAADAAAAVAPLLSGRVELSPGLKARVAPDDAVFVVVRLPGDPEGLPLAALRRSAKDLPFDFALRDPELVGAAQRFMQAPKVVVTARVSKTGNGHVEPGDLAGTARPVAPWTTGVVLVIDHPVDGR